MWLFHTSIVRLGTFCRFEDCCFIYQRAAEVIQPLISINTEVLKSMNKQSGQLRSGVILSYVNLALGSIIPMFYTPILLRLLGSNDHGVYSFANSIVGYLGLLSFGFGSTIVRYLAKYRAENDQAALRSTFGFFLLLYSGLAIFAIAGGVVLTTFSERIFGTALETSELKTVQKLVPILTVHIALNFPFSVFTSVILANERYFYRRIMDILATVITPAFNLVALYLGFGAIGIAVSGIVVDVILAVPNLYYCFSKLKLTPSFVKIPKRLIREMLGFSYYVFLGSIVDTLFWSTDKVILGMLVGSVAVSVYQIGGTFNHMVMQFSSSISGVLIPKVTGMVVKDASSEQLSSLFIRIGRIQYFVVALIASGFAAFGKAFINLWVGAEYIEAYWITILTLYPLCIPLIQNTGYQILMATNKHRFRAVVMLVVALLNIVSTWLVVPSMGGIGASLCSCVSYLLGHGLILNIYYNKSIKINVGVFWKQIAKMSIIPILMLFITLLIQRFVCFDSWISFSVAVGIYTIAYCLGMYRYSMNEYEKSIILVPLNKMRNLLRR